MTVRLVALGIVAALLCLLAYGVLTTGRGSPLDAAVARGERPAAPALALPPLEGGGATSLAAYRGRVVVLNYWASWCTPCRQEAPLLERWQARVARRGGTVLGVDALDVTTDARKFIREFHITYPVLRDRDGDTQKRFGVTGFPETIVLDRRGRVAGVRRGPVDDAFLRHVVPSLLRERQ
ncbi:MAG: TlpA family protein disulfide reductase [Actinobacteria bacterium]|nr:MAG: TlpA family protein disulfide reductase [Actinomycetota bacterium]